MKHFGTVLVLTLLGAFSPALYAGEEGVVVKNGRNVLKKHSSSIAILKTVSNTKHEGFGVIFGGAGKDEVSHTQAIFLDDSGLAVASYISLKNGKVVARRVHLGGEEEIITPKEEFKKFEFILADGSRIPAQIVITDPKLDLAILAPEKPLDAETKKKFSFVSLDSQKTPEMLDYVAVLYRLPQTLDSEPAVDLQRILAIIEKPRTLFITKIGPGRACFDDEGNFLGLGIFVHPEFHGGFGSMMEIDWVVLPAKYIQEVVEQAKAKLEKEKS